MGQLSGKKILVVDDEPDLREILKDLLVSEGALVLEADSGNTGFAVFNLHEFDALVTDVRMPNGTGIELVEKIHASGKKKPAIFISSAFTDITPEHARERGVVRIFSKPYDLDDLLATIGKALST